MEAKSKEFLMDSISNTNKQYYVRGVCSVGPIKLGDIFLKTYKKIYKKNLEGGFDFCGCENVCDIELVVIGIVAYRKDLKELSRGISAEISLVGAGGDLLLEGHSIGS